MDGLKNRVDKEWILFLFQMENAVRNYAVSDDIKADAVQEAAMKVLELLKKLPTFAELDQIDAIDEIVMWIVDGKSRYGNVYHFGSPFYAFTKTIVRFQLIDMIRRERNTNKITVQLEEIENDLYSNLTVSSPDEPERVVLAQLRKDLVNLLKLIDQVLKSKPRIVIIETLVARPQFWRVLKETNLSAPANYLPDSGVQSDAEIVRKLEITVSNLRAQRSQSLRRISAKDAILGELLKRLIAARGRG
ncbi:hypothetical protein KFU94_35470 [Chloroflexi bacterium TSY]|nr:hypothetical protein [Chloroflexi bacterium TSY]